ncbi:MAG: InlB B-repeat-containing protein [Methanomassiliicoccaceae archaeon]|nr:InlB B-repeat-containing protein [Methanomassiliicoccaceae archaeon]
MKNNIIFVIAVATLVVIGGMGYLYITDNKKPTVTLSDPDGSAFGFVPVTRTGYVDINKLEEIGSGLQERDGLTFAGWFMDAGCQEPFYDSKYKKITSNTVIYAGWNTLKYELHQGNLVDDKKHCTFTNKTDDASDTSWIVKDAFKTSNVPTYTGSETFTANVWLGMYEVTMTTYVNGEKKILSTTETVTGEISETVKWNDYSPNAKEHSITYSLDVSEYVEFAKLNRSRDFKISNIAKHAVYDSPAIEGIKNALMNLKTADWPNMTEQERADLIASFVNSGLSQQKLPDGNTDWFYYKIQPPGVHIINTSVEYYRYPVEALYDRILHGGLGDCDCHALLTAAIAKACGLDSAILVITNPSEKEGHAVAGIKGDLVFPPVVTGASNKEVNGYFACETFRPLLRLLVGNVQTMYMDEIKDPVTGETVTTGWKWEAFPVT